MQTLIDYGVCVDKKCSVVTFGKKLEIIAHIKKGKSVMAVSELCSIPKSTNGDTCKDREKIEVMSQQVSALPRRRFEANFERTDQACQLWFLQQHSNGTPISGPLLREKALLLEQPVYFFLYHK